MENGYRVYENPSFSKENDHKRSTFMVGFPWFPDDAEVYLVVLSVQWVSLFPVLGKDS